MPKRRTLDTLDPDALYQRYVRPLEQAHRDQYVLVTPAGQTVLAPTLLEAVREASKVPDERNFIFKVGQKSVGTIG
ncbi:MAG: hypothetical protein U0893_23875 [Chloroflexota bacterium]